MLPPFLVLHEWVMALQRGKGLSDHLNEELITYMIPKFLSSLKLEEIGGDF